MKSILKWLPIALGILLAFALGWWIAHPSQPDKTSATDSANDTIWTCSMHPQIQQPAPGLCPICNMDLVPMNSSGGQLGPREVMVSKGDAESLNLRVTPVSRHAASRKIELVGTIVPDERSLATVTARVGGRIDRLFVDYTGIQVRRADHLAEIYSPDLFVAQQELIQAKKSLDASSEALRPGRQALYRAAREKLRLFELTPEQIDEIEAQAQPSDHITINAPQAGIVTSLDIREGDYVKTGQKLFSVADLSSVWVRLEAYEQDLPWLRFAQKVSFTTEAAPGDIFEGRIAFIDPMVDPKTRTAKLRLNVDNPKGLLKPGLFVTAQASSTLIGKGALLQADLKGKWISPMHPEIIKDGPGTCDICGMNLVPAAELGFAFTENTPSNPLLIPASAVLHTGERAVVYQRVKSDTDGHLKFTGKTIRLGARVGHHYIVESGLKEGDFVVSRGAFKLDSELQIQGKESMMSMPASYAGPPVPSNPLDPPTLEKFNQALDSYLRLTAHLAHDREPEAGREVPDLVKALRTVGIATLSEAAAGLEGKSERPAITSALPPVTAALAEIIRSRAADQLEHPLFLHHCPMALDDGGDWLHPTRTIQNPYFGSEMFSCGEVKEQLTVKGAPAESHSGHHQH